MAKQRGCLTFLVATVLGMLVAGYVVVKIAERFAPPGADKLFAVQIGMFAAIDALAMGVLAYVANTHSVQARLHNPAVKVVCGFFCFGLMCGHGQGLAWLFATGAVNGLVGFVVWRALIWPISSSPVNAS